MQKYKLRLAIGMHKLLNKYKNIEGSYRSTLIYGVQTYLCNSGIRSDSWSAEDALTVRKRIGCESDVEHDDNLLDAWYNALDELDLQADKLMGELWELAEKCGEEQDDLANMLAEGEQVYNETHGLKRLLLFGC